MLLILALVINQVLSFSIPGISTKVYTHGEQVTTYMNELDSVTNQVPYPFYFLQFCKPKEGVTDHFQNLGSMLLGESTMTSSYNFYMGINQTCQKLCEINLSDLNVNDFKWFIDHNYRINMEADNLPVMQNLSLFGLKELHPGYPIGYIEEQGYYLNNHVKFEIEVFPVQEDQMRIVGFQVYASSITHTKQNENYIPICADYKNLGNEETYPLPQKLQPGIIVFSYDVEYIINPNKTYGSRWDYSINSKTEELQFFSLGVTFATTLSLTCFVAFLLRLALRRDIIKYQSAPELPQGNDNNEMGWKQVTRDVFRPPVHSMLLSVLIGTGIQLACLVICTLFLTCLGFVYQAHRGNLVTLIIVVFVFTGSINGYYTAKFYKYLKGKYWLLSTLASNIGFPAITLLIQWIIHLSMSLESSSSIVTFKTALTFLALWMGIQVPLNLVGAFLGYKIESTKNPCKYYPIPQYIPPQLWYLEDFYACVFGGLLCFASVGVEFSFIMQLVWYHEFYYFFAFLLMTVVLLFIICGELSIIVTYLSLIRGNHKWWWKSFLVPFSTGIYLFIYSIQYYMAELTFTRLSAILYYFGTMFLVSLVFGLICGTIGFISTYLFVHKIYSLIKND